MHQIECNNTHAVLVGNTKFKRKLDNVKIISGAAT